MAPGSSISHYRISAKLGEGGMGAVYRASDTRLNREVAIKVLPDSFAADPDRLARFAREAQVLASMNHPNIAALYGIEERALVMELVEGPTLAERIALGPMPVEEALPVARQIAEALEYAHEKGIIHRDLKPANVKVTPEGRVKVLDFGLAKALASEGAGADPASSPTLTMRATMAGSIIGTAGYMSPEQAKGKVVDRRADIWAFGCVLFEMLTGRPVFAGDGVSEILAGVIKEQPDLGDVALPLRGVIERCLRKDVRMRWQAIGDVRIALDEPAPAAEVMSLAPSAQRNPLPWAVAVVALAAAAVIGAVHFRESQPAREVIRFQTPPPEKAMFGPAFSLSPDGRLLAFSATAADGQSYIWIRPLNSLEATPLPATQGSVYLPFWSPDSRFLAFSTQGKLKKAAVAGGPAQVLCDAPAVVTGGSWSTSGVILFSSNAGPILKVDAAGGVAKPITRMETQESYHSYPFFLPDGRHFLYSRFSPNVSNSGLYAGAVDAKPEEQSRRPVSPAQFGVYAPGEKAEHGHLVFLRDRTLMAQPFDSARLQTEGETVPIAEPVGQFVNRGLFSVSPAGILAYQTGPGANIRVVWYDRHGAIMGDVGEAAPYRMPALSPDGKSLAVRRVDTATGNQDIWFLDLVRGGSSRFTFDPSVEQTPVWSPDGTQVLFASFRHGQADLYVKSSTMAGAEQLILRGSTSAIPYSWSPDGKYLLYGTIEAKTSADLWILRNPGDPTAEHTSTLFLQTEFRETGAQFSPDGRWVAYVSDASSRPEIYVRPFPPGRDNAGQWMVSSGGGSQPRWNRNGKELLYFSGRKLMSVDVNLNGVFRAGVPKPLFDAPVLGGTDAISSIDWDLSPDGTRFLILSNQSADSGGTPISVIVNWQELLGK